MQRNHGICTYCRSQRVVSSCQMCRKEVCDECRDATFTSLCNLCGVAQRRRGGAVPPASGPTNGHQQPAPSAPQHQHQPGPTSPSPQHRPPAPPQQAQAQTPPPQQRIPPQQTSPVAPSPNANTSGEIPARFAAHLTGPASAHLRNLHAQLGDYGEFIKRDNTFVVGRIVASCSRYVYIAPEGAPEGHEEPHKFEDIFTFSRDDTKSVLPNSRDALLHGSGAEREIETLDLLGQGGQGQVFKARYVDAPPGEFIVVKQMSFPQHEAHKADDAEAKARDIMNLRHEHLIQYLEVRRPKRTVVQVVMPYYKEKDMVQFLGSLKKNLSEYELCSLVLQLAKALDSLHSARPARVHRDVKLDNVLMFDNGTRTMLVDLDLIGSLPQGGLATTTVCGTYEYQAPEVEARQTGPPADVWALGIILFILLALPNSLLCVCPRTGRPEPFGRPCWDQELINQTVRGDVQKSAARRGTKYSPELTELCVKMLQRDPSRRPSAKDVAEILQNIMIASLTSA